MSNVFDFLTPGSTWRNPAGRQVWFLSLTNQTLSAARQLKHPPRVIYFDSKGNVFDRTVDEFFAHYTFHNVDGDVETSIERLFAFHEPQIERATPAPVVAEEPFVLPQIEIPGSDETAPEQVPVEASIRVEGVAHVTAKSLAEQELQRLEGVPSVNVHQARIEFDIPQGLTVDRELLESACVGYSEQLVLSHGLQQHTLTFVEANGLTAESLTELFFAGELTIDSFGYRVGASNELRQIVTNGWIGVTRGVLGGLPVLNVNMTTAPNVQAESEEGLSEAENQELRELLAERLSETAVPVTLEELADEAVLLEALVARDAVDLQKAAEARAEGFADPAEVEALMASAPNLTPVEAVNVVTAETSPAQAFGEHQVAGAAATVAEAPASDIVDFGDVQDSGAISFDEAPAPEQNPNQTLASASAQITAELLADPRVQQALAEHQARQNAAVAPAPVVGSIVVNQQ